MNGSSTRRPAIRRRHSYDDGFLFTSYLGNPLSTVASAANPTGINNIAFSAGCSSGDNCSDKILQVVWTGAKYSITRNLDVIGAYYHYIQNTYIATTAGASVCASTSAHSQCAGTFDAASGVIDWRFAPKWDTYIGVMFSQNNGGLSNGYLSRNNVDPTAGLRFRF